MKPLFLAADQDPRIAEFFVLDGSDYRLELAAARALDPPDLSRAVMTLASLEAKVTDLYLAATAPEGDAGTAVSAAEAEALRGAVQQLIAHAERLRAAIAPRS